MSRIVELHDRTPLAVRKDQIEGDATYVCRCGLSNQWPLCDGTHKQAALEPAGRVFLYTRKGGQLQRQEVSAVQPGQADPRAGQETVTPQPGTEAEAQRRRPEPEAEPTGT